MNKKTSHHKSNRQWIKAHLDDPYVKQARQQGYRSRAAFKLIEIQQRDKVIKPGAWIIDLGASPGGWSQLAAKWVGRNGHVIAVDCLPMESIAGVTFFQGDFTEQSILDALLSFIGDRKIELVMSDMAPNISGIRAVDQPKSMHLAELAFELAQNVLDKNGSFLTKLFTGSGNEQYIKQIRKDFDKVVTRKPKASRSNSREVYLLATGYNQ